MDQPLDFSFHKLLASIQAGKVDTRSSLLNFHHVCRGFWTHIIRKIQGGNPLAIIDDELESPKPMPKSPDLCHLMMDKNVDSVSDLKEVAPFPSVALEVIETLSISPARSLSTEGETSCQPSTSSAIENSNSNGAYTSVPKFSDDSQGSTSKPKARAKVPLERGFTQVDWLKLTRTQPDLAGLKGATNKRFVTKAEVKQHKSEDDAWTILKGKVYNITPYLKFHPGGVDMLMKGAGKDCTALFNKYHSWVNAEYLLEKCLVGFLEVEN